MQLCREIGALSFSIKCSPDSSTLSPICRPADFVKSHVPTAERVPKNWKTAGPLGRRRRLCTAPRIRPGVIHRPHDPAVQCQWKTIRNGLYNRSILKCCYIVSLRSDLIRGLSKLLPPALRSPTQTTLVSSPPLASHPLSFFLLRAP